MGLFRIYAAALGALLTIAAPAVATSDTPEIVVQALVDAMQANDAEGIRAAFAAEARQAYGAGIPKSGDAFRAWLESDIITPHGRVEDAALTVEGNAVIVTGRYRNANGYTSAADFLMTVEEGQIVSWQMRY